jgi:hypothetical protein
MSQGQTFAILLIFLGIVGMYLHSQCKLLRTLDILLQGNNPNAKIR